MNRFWKAALIAIATLVVAGTVVGFVAAQTDGDVSMPGKERLNNFISRLAGNLGITQEELEVAIDQTQLELVDEAVADGRITEEKAAEIRTRIESGEGPFFAKRPHRGYHHGGNVVGQVAEFLGLTTQEVTEALQGGQSLAQIAEAQGVSTDKLVTFLLGELEARLAEAVDSGKIDQARADEKLANASERITQMINREGPPRGGPHRSGPKGGFDGSQSGFPGGFRESGFPQPAPEVSDPVF